MKLKTIVGNDHDEEVIIYCKEISELVEKIENLIKNDAIQYIGYKDNKSVILDLNQVFGFTIESNKIYAITENDKLRLKSRLYQLENDLPQNFIKINQSTIVNSEKISHFDATFSGTLTVVLKNGFCDYVSRRNIKKVKERLGI